MIKLMPLRHNKITQRKGKFQWEVVKQPSYRQLAGSDRQADK